MRAMANFGKQHIREESVRSEAGRRKPGRHVFARSDAAGELMEGVRGALGALPVHFGSKTLVNRLTAVGCEERREG